MNEVQKNAVYELLWLLVPIVLALITCFSVQYTSLTLQLIATILVFVLGYVFQLALRKMP
jgi:hypothetical protein